jgi:hypothetical protein
MSAKRNPWHAPFPLRWLAGLFSLISIAMLFLAMVVSGGRFDVSAFNDDIADLLEGSVEPGASLALQRSVLLISPEGPKISLDGVTLIRADGHVIAMDQTEATLPWSSLFSGEFRPRQLQVNGGTLSFDLTNKTAMGAEGHVLVTGSFTKATSGRPEWLDMLQGKSASGPQLSIKDLTVTVRLDAEKPPLRLSGISLRREKTENGDATVLTVPDLGSSAVVRIAPDQVQGQSANTVLTFALQNIDAAKMARLFDQAVTLPASSLLFATGTVELNAAGLPQMAQAQIVLEQDINAPLQSLSGQVLWQRAVPEIALSSVVVKNDTWAAKLDGWVTQSQTGIRLRAENGRLTLNSGKSRFEAQNMAFEATFDRTTQQIDVPAFGTDVAGIRIEGQVTSDDTLTNQSGYLARIKASQIDLSALRSQYPALFTPEIDKALAQLQSGRVQDATADLRFAINPSNETRLQTVSGQLLRFKARFADIHSAALDGIPALADVDGVVSANGDIWQIDANKATVLLGTGVSQGLDRLSVRFEAQPNGKPKGEVEAAFSGPVGALRDRVSKMPIEPEISKALASLGNEGKASVTVSAPITARLKDSMSLLTLRASLDGAKISKIIEGEDITQAKLTATSAKGRIEIKGDGKLRGIPVGLSFLRESSSAVGKPQLTATLDDAARDKLGLPFGKALRGKVKLVVAPTGDDENRARIELDLTTAKIIDLVPGWNKPAGRKASARMTIRKGGKAGIEIEDLVLDGGTLSARGAITLRRDGSFEIARLSPLRLPGGEKGSATIKRQGSTWQLALEMNSLDARPWMKRLDEMSSSGKMPVALSLSATALQGHNGEIIGGAKLETRLEGTKISEAKFSGTLNGKPVLARLAPKNGQMQLAVSGGDAGALMRFADLYTRMWGGRIDSRISLKNGAQIGAVLVQNFVLADEPALRGIVAQTGIKGSTTRTAFSVGRLRFERNDSQLKLREAVMWGDAVGGNITGDVDYANDSIDLAGSFVPAYALNNLFAKLPLVGAVLGGESYEGLFAVPFTITGRASSPKLTVNALSAVAPGILRKLLDFKEKPGLEPVSLEPRR